MRRGIVAAGATAVLVCSLLAPRVVVASEKGWPLEGPARILVAFGERYQRSDGTAVTHRGVDLAAAAGSGIRSVLPGTVTFAGRVPAGEGATTLAVTIESGDIRLTYSPLAELDVVSGETLSAEARIGALAATGDASHPEPHLHLSARRDTLYVDPEPFLAPPPIPDGADPVEAPAAITAAPLPPAPSAAGGASSASAVPQGSGASSAQGASGIEAAVSPAPQTSAIRTAEGLNVGRNTQASNVGSADDVGSDTKVDGTTHGGSKVRRTSDALLSQVGLDPERTRTALVENRRESAMSGIKVSRALVMSCAGALALALLWPVWRSVPLAAAHAGPASKDVAAVLAR